MRFAEFPAFLEALPSEVVRPQVLDPPQHETLEEAVTREVEEETNIRITDVRYQASQPWPFPSSLMLGFRAQALTTDIEIDGRELEAARWFTADEVHGFGEWGDTAPKDKRLPRTDSISRWLINGWLEVVEGG